MAKRKDISYTLRYSEGLDHNKIEILDIDIIREENSKMLSILKNPYRIRYPMSGYMEQCIKAFPNPVHWKDCISTRENMIDIEFHKAVHKINDAIIKELNSHSTLFCAHRKFNAVIISTYPEYADYKEDKVKKLTYLKEKKIINYTPSPRKYVFNQMKVIKDFTFYDITKKILDSM